MILYDLPFWLHMYNSRILQYFKGFIIPLVWITLLLLLLRQISTPLSHADNLYKLPQYFDGSLHSFTWEYLLQLCKSKLTFSSHLFHVFLSVFHKGYHSVYGGSPKSLNNVLGTSEVHGQSIRFSHSH